MSDDTCIRAVWTGEAFEPRGNWSVAWCQDKLGAGEVVTLDVEWDRSMRSHRHQFAEIREMWATLPESLADAPYARSPETLRKHALIKTGYVDAQTIDAGSKAAAERVAATVTPLAQKAHGYAITIVKGPLVVVFSPRSQSLRTMGADEFQKSKDAVLDWISKLLQEVSHDRESVSP